MENEKFDLDIEILGTYASGEAFDDFIEEPREAVFEIASHLFKGDKIEMISLVSRITFDFDKKEIY